MVFLTWFLREKRKRDPVCVCVCVPVNVCVDMGVGLSVPWPPLAQCGSEKCCRLMVEVMKSGVVATLPQGEVQSQPKGGGGVDAAGTRGGDTPHIDSLRPSTPCLGSLELGGGQGSRRQPLDSTLRERSLGLLTQWHYLSSRLGYCSGEHFLSLCKHFLSLA